MEQRLLGGSGFKVPVLSLGTGTFGGGTDFFRAWGIDRRAGATRLVDICLEAGLNMFDTRRHLLQGPCRGRSWARRSPAGATR